VTRRAAAAVALGLLVVGWYAWPTETRAVRTRIETLVAAIGDRDNETDIARLARVAVLSAAMTPDVVVSLDGQRRLHGREEVLGAARAMMHAHGAHRLEIDQMEVAVIDLSATADLTLRVDDESYHDIRLRLIQQGDTWLVRQAEVQPPLVRPGISR
jgi:hypothetical protein